MTFSIQSRFIIIPPDLRDKNLTKEQKEALSIRKYDGIIGFIVWIFFKTSEVVYVNSDGEICSAIVKKSDLYKLILNLDENYDKKAEAFLKGVLKSYNDHKHEKISKKDFDKVNELAEMELGNVLKRYKAEKVNNPHLKSLPGSHMIHESIPEIVKKFHNATPIMPNTIDTIQPIKREVVAPSSAPAAKESPSDSYHEQVNAIEKEITRRKSQKLFDQNAPDPDNKILLNPFYKSSNDAHCSYACLEGDFVAIFGTSQETTPFSVEQLKMFGKNGLPVDKLFIKKNGDLTDEEAAAIADIIRNNPIRTLKFQNFTIPQNALQIIMKAIGESVPIANLMLENCHCSASEQWIRKFWTECSGIGRLVIANSKEFHDQIDAANFLLSLQHDPEYWHEGNTVYDCDSLIKLIRNNKIMHISLNLNCFLQSDLEKILEALKDNTSLVKLRLKFDRLTDANLQKLIVFIKDNKKTPNIRLSFSNKIPQELADLLAKKQGDGFGFSFGLSQEEDGTEILLSALKITQHNYLYLVGHVKDKNYNSIIDGVINSKVERLKIDLATFNTENLLAIWEAKAKEIKKKNKRLAINLLCVNPDQEKAASDLAKSWNLYANLKDIPMTVERDFSRNLAYNFPTVELITDIF